MVNTYNNNKKKEAQIETNFDFESNRMNKTKIIYFFYGK